MATSELTVAPTALLTDDDLPDYVIDDGVDELDGAAEVSYFIV